MGILRKIFRLKNILCTFVVLIFFLGLGVFIYMQLSLPKLVGEQKFSGLKDKVVIVRDPWGTPHIKAKSRRDVTMALGYLMASERWFQMEVHRRVSRGELAEVFGRKALRVDMMYRTFNFAEHFKKVRQTHPMPKELEDELAWFFEGVNAYIASHPRPIEFWLTGIPVRTFSLDDAYAFIGYMSYSFGIGLRQDSFFTLVKDRLEKDFFQNLRSEPLNVIQKISGVEELHQYLIKGFSPFEGSNGWVIAPHKTKSKKALLANDPHITFSKPNLWMEAHLMIEGADGLPVVNEYGYFLPLIALPVLYHSPDKAWGLTMSMTDDMDLYRLKTTNDGRAYILDGKPVDFEIKKEVIPIKGGTTFEMEVKRSVFGPVLDYVLNPSEEKFRNIAFHWSVFKPHNDPLTSLFRMREAKSMKEFKAAVATGVAPGLNILYADKEDNIGWWLFGEVEIKPSGLNSDVILTGEKRSDLPSKVVPFSKLPFAENPKSGFIVSANSKPDGFPKNVRGEFQPRERFDTILAVLNKKSDWSVEETEALQVADFNINSQSRLAFLVSFLGEKEWAYLSQGFQKEVREWDGLSPAHSRVAALFYAWLKHLSRESLVGLSNEEKSVYSQFHAEWFRLSRMLKTLSNQVEKDQQLVVNAFHKAIEELKVRQGNDERKWSWGKMHTLEFVHPLGMVTPLNYIFNEGPHPVGGAFNEINNMKWGTFDQGFEVKAGPSTRRVIDFGSIYQTRAVLPLGISGHGLSPFRKNQLSLFLKGQYREMNMSPEVFRGSSENQLELVP